MSAGPKHEFTWTDAMKKTQKCSAPRYIDYSMNWMQSQFDNESVFPSAIGIAFPKNFTTIARTMLKYLFHIYAHIYHEHFNQIIQLKEEAHLNTSFKHFILFIQEFNLIEKKDLVPLQELIERFL
jgi:MOB kinase activator 1